MKLYSPFAITSLAALLAGAAPSALLASEALEAGYAQTSDAGQPKKDEPKKDDKKKKDKGKEGHCGADKGKHEGACGADKKDGEKKGDKEGSCGEGTCG